MGPRGILVQYRNTSAASGSKKASYVEKGKAQGGQISNSSNCKGKSPTSENCKGKNSIHPIKNADWKGRMQLMLLLSMWHTHFSHVIAEIIL